MWLCKLIGHKFNKGFGNVFTTNYKEYYLIQYCLRCGKKVEL